MSAAIAYDPIEARRQRGMEIAAVCRIDKGKGCYMVPSQNRKHRYEVMIGPGGSFCSCPDFAERQKPCKHIYAVEFTLKREASVTVETDGEMQTVTETVTVTATKRTTYKQNWPAYNAAQTNEKRKLQGLLAELCRGIEEPPTQTTGRPRMPLRDAVWACVFKVYSTVSGRRFTCDMEDAHERGHLSRPVHYNSIAKHMEMKGLTPILHRLIVESALPLKAVETRFAVDSSGFMTSRFVRWFDQKYGGFQSKYDWVKAHVITGVTTNVVTAVAIGDAYAADGTMFAPLVDKTAENFTIDEVSADSAYQWAENFEAVTKHGGTPYIDFRRNTTAAAGGTFAKMFHLYSYERDEYARHYHARSNVESTFSMVKAKFGDSLRSKSDTAMVNESLCKILCHNLCCLILSAYELGITAKFWGTDEATEALPTPTVEDEAVEGWGWV